MEESATFLEYDLICNLPCVQYAADKKLVLDEDWFYVKIPARKTGEIVIVQHGLENSLNGTPTNIRFQLLGEESKLVVQNDSLSIKNTSFTERYFYFRVFPESTKLFSSGSSVRVIEYTISLNKIHGGL